MAHSLYHSSPYQSAAHPFPSMARPAVAEAHSVRAHTQVHAVQARTRRPLSGEPNYLARRSLVAVLALVAATTLVAALLLLAGLGGRPASASQAEPAISNTGAVYVASAGDSLWSIAEANHGDVGLDRYVDALIDLNGGTEVQIGQAIQLP